MMLAEDIASLRAEDITLILAESNTYDLVVLKTEDIASFVVSTVLSLSHDDRLFIIIIEQYHII